MDRPSRRRTAAMFAPSSAYPPGMMGVLDPPAEHAPCVKIGPMTVGRFAPALVPVLAGVGGEGQQPLLPLDALQTQVAHTVAAVTHGHPPTTAQQAKKEEWMHGSNSEPSWDVPPVRQVFRQDQPGVRGVGAPEAEPEDDNLANLPPSTERPCGHNDWDDVRTRKGTKMLRCRICQRKWKLPSNHVPRCLHFLRGACNDHCSLLHVHKKKCGVMQRYERFGEAILHAMPKPQNPPKPQQMPRPATAPESVPTAAPAPPAAPERKLSVLSGASDAPPTLASSSAFGSFVFGASRRGSLADLLTPLPDGSSTYATSRRQSRDSATSSWGAVSYEGQCLSLSSMLSATDDASTHVIPNAAALPWDVDIDFPVRRKGSAATCATEASPRAAPKAGPTVHPPARLAGHTDGAALVAVQQQKQQQGSPRGEWYTASAFQPVAVAAGVSAAASGFVVHGASDCGATPPSQGSPVPGTSTQMSTGPAQETSPLQRVQAIPQSAPTVKESESEGAASSVGSPAHVTRGKPAKRENDGVHAMTDAELDEHIKKHFGP